MKILLILDRFFPTDHAFLETVYSKLLPEHGHTIICMARTRTIDTKKTKWNSIDVHLFHTGKRPAFFWKRFQRMHILWKAIILTNRNRFEIVQVRNWEYGSLVALVLKKIYGTRFVFQRSFPIDENYLADLKEKKLSFRSAFKKRVLLYLYPKILHRADAILAISSEMKRRMLMDGFDGERIYPVGLSYDSSLSTDPQAIHRIVETLMIRDEKIILYFGKMDPKRELEFMLDVCKQLNRRDFVMVFLGGDREDIDRLREYSGKIGLANRISYIGKVPREEVSNYIAVSYLTVSPIPPIKRFSVASPTKLFESMGLGIPVVGNNLPVQKEVLMASNGGLCVSYEVRKFAEAIASLLDHPDKRNKMGQNARGFILSNYTYDSMINQIEQIYEHVVQPTATI